MLIYVFVSIPSLRCDLIDVGRREEVAQQIRDINPACRVVPCRHGKVNLGQVLKAAFSLFQLLFLSLILIHFHSFSFIRGWFEYYATHVLFYFRDRAVR